jgi:hypothetical protein
MSYGLDEGQVEVELSFLALTMWIELDDEGGAAT